MTTIAAPVRLPKALTPPELDALRAVPKNQRDQALIEILAGCGLRVSEACNLRIDQIHWTTETPALRFTGKRGRERVVPLNLQAQDALRLWLDQRAHRSPYVFCNLRTGGRLSRKTVWDALKRYASRAGIRPVHPHMLRHTFGTGLANRNVPIEQIRELMGHTSIRTSQIYIAVSTEQKRASVERIDQRPALIRWLSRQRNRSYRFLDRALPVRNRIDGQAVGRQEEFRQLQANVDKRVDTLVIGSVGVGKSHLLQQLQGQRLIRLDNLTPVRQAIIALAEQLHERGVFPSAQAHGPDHSIASSPDTMRSAPKTRAYPDPAGQGDPPPGGARPASPSGESAEDPDENRVADTSERRALQDFDEFRQQHARTSVAEWTQMVLEAVEQEAWVLVIDDLTGLTATTARLVRQLGRKFVLVGALESVPRNQSKHFWKFDQVPLGPLPDDEALRLIRQRVGDAEVEDPQLLETQVLRQSAGNPRAILEMVERLRKEPAITPTAVRELKHTGARPQIDLTPAIIVPLVLLIAARFIARGLGSVEVYVLAGIGAAVAMGLQFMLFRSRR
ncbi:MAG: tyrosine-type recombinase/integrase [Candidatus Latescibacteria bacterium]|nr:tyrosine-type recombinase/integrase [Candidatus Latescibacterota bacterium]